MLSIAIGMSDTSESETQPLRLSLSNLNEEMDRIYITNGWSPPRTFPSPPRLRRQTTPRYHDDDIDMQNVVQQELQTTSEPLDSVVRSVIKKFMDRAEMGKKKYGTDLDRTDLSIDSWINHAQEELMDGILYLEKLKQETEVK